MAKIRNRYNEVPNLIQDTNGIVTNSQLDITNESQEVDHFPADDHKGTIIRRQDRNNMNDSQKSTALEWSDKKFTGGLKPVSRPQPHPYFRCGLRHIDVWFDERPLTYQCIIS